MNSQSKFLMQHNAKRVLMLFMALKYFNPLSSWDQKVK